MLYTIEVPIHTPSDLLAFDMYGDKDLWWVFAQRNLEKLKDPIFDFEAGTEIFVMANGAAHS